MTEIELGNSGYVLYVDDDEQVSISHTGETPEAAVVTAVVGPYGITVQMHDTKHQGTELLKTTEYQMLKFPTLEKWSRQ